MKMTSLLLTLALVFTASLAQAGDDAKKSTNENGVAFMDNKCFPVERAKRLVFADADVDFLSSGVMLKSGERVLLVKLTARTGFKETSNLVLFLKRDSRSDNKTIYSFDTKLGATLAIEEVGSPDGRMNTMKISMTEESGITETTVVCSNAFSGN